MKCIGCNRDYDTIAIVIRDKNGSRCFCPNCITIGLLDKNITFENDECLIDDVTQEYGAVHYGAFDERYTLDSDRMRRLILHNLYPDEYFSLAERYGDDSYQIHEDFYDELGFAIQPYEDD